MIEDTVNCQNPRCFYPVRNIEFFQHSTHAFIDRVRRNVHQARDLFGIFVLVNMPQRFNLRGRQQAYVIVGVAVHRRWNRASRVEIKVS